MLGQNVNAYNYKEKKISNLIQEFSKIKDLKRIRYTTSHPIDFTQDLIAAHKEIDKLMPLVHLPVQSGSDKILKKMNRKHTIKNYLEIVGKLKKANPKIEFSSDFIIGYPGETNDDFNKTLKLVEEVGYIDSYSFLYSPRPGTPAAKMNEIDREIAKERLISFQEVANKIKLKYREKLYNRKSSVLFENETKKGNEFFGRDEFSNSVIVKSEKNLTGKIKEVIITSGNQNTLFGKIVQKLDKKDFAA